MRAFGMRLILIFGFIVSMMASFVGHAETRSMSEVRTTSTLDPGWRFLRDDVANGGAVDLDDSDWSKVDLPHSYNADDGLSAKYYRGPAWYRRTVMLSKPAADTRTFIEFDGAALAADVWINGAKVGRHEGGYARFRFDITPYIRSGSNVVAVRVDNSKLSDVAPLGGDFTVFGGLYRGVRLVTTHDVHLDMLDYGSPGVVFTASDVTAEGAKLNWAVRLKNDRKKAARVKLTVRLRDAQDKTVAAISKVVNLPTQKMTSITLRAMLDAPHLWQGAADPYLYVSEVELAMDAASPALLDRMDIPVGIRDIRIDADKGLLLNGRVYGVHGVAIHQTILPGKGPAVSEADIDADWKLLDDLGMTGMRFAHYQHAPHEYDLADRKGYLIWTEVPLVAEVDASKAFQTNIAQQLRELIRQNINHPSVYVWGLGNEINKEDDASAHTLDALQKLAKKEDSSRPTTYANCCNKIDGPQSSHTDLLASNMYFGWYNDEFSDFGPRMDDNHVRRPKTPEAISEYGAGASILHQEDPPLRPKTDGHWHPEQYQALYHESSWKQIEARPWLWASYIWVGFDFPSAGRDEGDHVGINDKGLITFDRKVKKDAYYWYQANWTAAPMLYITSRRDDVRTSPDVEVKIYSNQPSVDLRLNGIDQGTQAVIDHIARWKVKLTPGSNRIEAAAGGLSDSVDWTYRQ